MPIRVKTIIKCDCYEDIKKPLKFALPPIKPLIDNSEPRDVLHLRTKSRGKLRRKQLSDQTNSENRRLEKRLNEIQARKPLFKSNGSFKNQIIEKSRSPENISTRNHKLK